MGSWGQDDGPDCDLGDARLNRRLGAMPEALETQPGKALPTACHERANTKAA
jgi:hypothetical protein